MRVMILERMVNHVIVNVLVTWEQKITLEATIDVVLDAFVPWEQRQVLK